MLPSAQSDPAGGNDVKVTVEKTERPTTTVWYVSPLWLAIGAIIVLLVIVLIAVASNSGGGGATIVKT
jgi:hypothetical protein